jgi:hypothetical protein
MKFWILLITVLLGFIFSFNWRTGGNDKLYYFYDTTQTLANYFGVNQDTVVGCSWFLVVGLTVLYFRRE